MDTWIPYQRNFIILPGSEYVGFEFPISSIQCEGSPSDSVHEDLLKFVNNSTARDAFEARICQSVGLG